MTHPGFQEVSHKDPFLSNVIHFFKVKFGVIVMGKNFFPTSTRGHKRELRAQVMMVLRYRFIIHKAKARNLVFYLFRDQAIHNVHRDRLY